MTASRVGFAIFGWLGAVILLVNGMVLSLWSILTLKPSFLIGAFAMLALAFVVAAATNMFQRRFRRNPPGDAGRVWALTGAFAGVVVVTLVLTVLVTSIISG